MSSSIVAWAPAHCLSDEIHVFMCLFHLHTFLSMRFYTPLYSLTASACLRQYIVIVYRHIHTHKNAYSFCCIALSLSLPLYLWFTSCFFAGKKIQKVLKIMHINFLVLILLVFFGRFASMWALFPPSQLEISYANHLERTSCLCAGSASPAAFWLVMLSSLLPS